MINFGGGIPWGYTLTYNPEDQIFPWRMVVSFLRFLWGGNNYQGYGSTKDEAINLLHIRLWPDMVVEQ